MTAEWNTGNPSMIKHITIDSKGLLHMKKTIKRLLLPALILVIILAATKMLFQSAENESSPPKETSSTPQPESSVTTDNNNTSPALFRGVWVSYITTDMGKDRGNEEKFRSKTETIMKDIRDIGADTVIYQVRPFCDSYYPSKLFPFSHLISGEQGKDPGFDPLEIALETAKKYGLKFHAWVNPMRVSLEKTPGTLSQNNPCVKWLNDSDKSNDKYILKYGGTVYLDPAYPEVRRLIIDGVREIVRNYDVDGIQIDDYFYPENIDIKNKTINIDMLVAGIFSAVHSQRSDCVFGISPQCDPDNDLRMGADVRRWCRIGGYADYICPQLYVSEEHPALPFEKAAGIWKEMMKDSDVTFYAGLAFYKAGTDADNGTWKLHSDNIARQEKLSLKYGFSGTMLFSYEDLKDPAKQEEKRRLTEEMKNEK